MDLDQTIRELYEEKEKLERVIASLEELQGTLMAGSGVRERTRRGRKFMSPDERLEVSERMKTYWAKRRRSADK
jgi:hypothetical protein